MKTFTQKDLELAANLLRLAADEFSNHGCNDIDDDLLKDWTDQEQEQLCKDYEQWNSGMNPEEGDKINEDWILMYAIANRLDGRAD